MSGDREKSSGECVAGYVFAMAVATDAHKTIAVKVASIFRPHLRRSVCRGHIVDVNYSIYKREDAL
ncbi:MAG: hypothetical protein J2P21_09960 [Chloracidobacterium sp.]|nr:hypothetical protein [Chloracidobacterium sp.]